MIDKEPPIFNIIGAAAGAIPAVFVCFSRASDTECRLMLILACPAPRWLGENCFLEVQPAEIICFSARGVLGAAKRLLTELKRVYRSGNRTVEGIAIVADRKKDGTRPVRAWYGSCDFIQQRVPLDNTVIRCMVLDRANYAFSSFRSPELRQPI